MSTVIALHSSGMSGRQWRSLAERLGAEHRVLTPDFIGSGANPPWPDDRPFHFREDVAEIAKLVASQSEPVHLVGHSYGGFLVLQLLLDEATRARVRSIAVYDPVAFGVLSAERPDSDLPFDDATGGDEAWFRVFVEWWNGKGAWDALPPPSRAQFLKIGRKVYWEVKSLVFDETPASAYAPFRGRALVLNGEKTPAPARRVGEVVASALPSSERIVVAGAGHMGPLTHTTIVNDAIASHLAKVPLET
jgi:pimeloyl-ACP methyl ester carboxylesterase